MISAEDRGRSLARASSTTSIHSGHQLRLSLPPKQPRAVSVQHNGPVPVIRHGSADLRQTAIRNGLLRTASNTSVNGFNQPGHPAPAINKNIPMISKEPKPARNLGQRWANFSIVQPLEAEEQPSPPVQDEIPADETGRDFNKASVSPLTYVKNAAPSTSTPSTSMLATPATPTTDNRFEDLLGSDAKLTTSSKTTRTSTLYHRMSLLISSVRNNDHTSMHSLLARYASELDTSDDDESSGEHDPDSDSEGPTLAGVDASNARLAIPLEIGGTESILDVMKEVSDFQSALIDRSSPRKEAIHSTRTQRKLLDFKDLMGDEKSPTPAFTNLLDYSLKIQHEAILSEWTQVRLRFSSHQVPSSASNLSCSAGVLGFVQRYKGHEWVHDIDQVLAENAASYLQEMWTSEQVSLVASPARALLPTFDEGVDVYSDNSTSMSSLARSVMMAREVEPRQDF